MGKEISSKEKDLLICSCHSTDHQMVVLYGEDDIDGIIYPKFIFTRIYLKDLSGRELNMVSNTFLVINPDMVLSMNLYSTPKIMKKFRGLQII